MRKRERELVKVEGTSKGTAVGMARSRERNDE